jgi:ATP-dependent RNA helicase DDX54/DBP10
VCLQDSQDALWLSFSPACLETVVHLYRCPAVLQVREIIGQLREGRQSLMFSATLPRSLADFAAAGLSNPQLVRLDAERKLSPDLGLAFFTGKAGHVGPCVLTCRWMEEFLSFSGFRVHNDNTSTNSNAKNA